MVARYEDLKNEVIERFASNKALRKQLAMSLVEWQTPVVGIQDILLDTKPSDCCRTATGMRNLNKKEYEKVVKNWEEKLIGGREEFDADCKKRTWYPPKGSQLYRLQRIETGIDNRVYEYFLLIHNDTYYFLARLSGPKNSLRVLDRDDAIFFEDSLRNVLSWKPSND